MITVALAMLGLVFGSFTNAFVWRLREQEALRGKTSKAAVKKLQELSITKGRSMCPNCSHTLAAKDLVPVFSWLYLRGKCRYCHKPIPDSPLVELATALLFVVSYLAWPLGFNGTGLLQFIYCLVFIVLFVSLAVYDLRWFLLPDRVVVPVTLLAVSEVVVVAIWQHSWAAAWQPAVGGLIIFGLFYGLYQLSQGRWIGGGDVKLALALGLIAASPIRAFLVIFIASLLGTLASAPLLAKGKKGLKLHIPFGPYLLAGTLIVVLYGERVIHWYTSLFLPTY